MLDFDLLKDCYGCGACVNVCPRGAVHMTQAADGTATLPLGISRVTTLPAPMPHTPRTGRACRRT